MNDDRFSRSIEEEQEMKKMIGDKFRNLQPYTDQSREILAYRLSEIMVAVKKLYTEDLQEIRNIDSDREEEMWDSLMGMRMNMLHIKDCIEDFDMMMMELMDDGKGEDEDEEPPLSMN